MKKILVLLVVLFLASSLMVACGGDKKESRSGDDRALTSAPERDQGLAERPPFEAEGISRNFVAAETYYRNGQLERSARELREAAQAVDKISGRGDTESKQKLKARAEDLRYLAREVEAGTVRSDKELERTFYRTYNTLAGYHFEQANQFWSKEMVNETGQSLESAGDYLDEASAWGGRKIDSATDRTVQGARSISRRIRQGARWTSDEIGESLSSIGDRIKKQGQEMDLPPSEERQIQREVQGR